MKENVDNINDPVFHQGLGFLNEYKEDLNVAAYYLWFGLEQVQIK